MLVRYKGLGGVDSVTGSRHLLEIDDKSILLDCGLFQGLKKLRLRNWDDFPYDPKKISAVVLSHAHIDHSGYLPKLIKEGFNGPIYCTHATEELLRIMLVDSAKLQEEEAEWAYKKGYSKYDRPQPLYTEKEAMSVFPLLVPCNFNTRIPLDEKILLSFRIAGHILGASIVQLDLKGDFQNKKIVFSGDLGRNNDPLMMPPEVINDADILFVESTYGNREREPIEVMESFGKMIRDATDKGVVLIPAFSVGRTQNILFYLKNLMEKGEIPTVPVYIDSPMAISVTDLYKSFSDIQKLRSDELGNGISLFDYHQFNYVRNRSQSAILNEVKKNAIIISASGMCTGGRILHHLFHRLQNKNDTVILVGFQAEGTRGRDLLEGAEKIKIFGLEVPVLCNVEILKGMSAHADQQELMEWIGNYKKSPKKVFVVHGEKTAAERLSELIQEKLHFNCTIPYYQETIELFNGI